MNDNTTSENIILPTDSEAKPRRETRVTSGTNIGPTVSQARCRLEIPEGLSREAVEYRMNALIDAGTPLHLAEELALTAEQQQADRDKALGLIA